MLPFKPATAGFHQLQNGETHEDLQKHPTLQTEQSLDKFISNKITQTECIHFEEL